MSRPVSAPALPARVTADEPTLCRLAADLAMAARAGDVISLAGDLGAGKSTFARAFIRALADDPGLEVPSPTYTLVQSYDLPRPALHADLYRLADADDLGELGLDEVDDAILLVEWPDRAPDLARRATLTVRLSGSGANRNIALQAAPEAASRFARSLAIRTFLRKAGLARAARRLLSADASVRGYEGIDPAATDSFRPDHGLLLMDSPRRPDGPPIRDGLPYSRIAHLAEDVNAFAAIAHGLAEAGFAAPAIHAADFDQGLLLVENLGGDVIIDEARRPIADRWIASARLLAALHAVQWPDTITGHGGPAYRVPAYDRTAMQVEVELLPAWYWRRRTGKAPTPAESSALADAWDAVFDTLAGTETTLVLRDYHSPNIIWRDDRSGNDRVGLIDFQDAVIGPSAYDVASLGRDARVDVPDDVEQAVRDAYCAARFARDAAFDRAAFEAAYAVMAAQRNAKILGIFVRLDERDGKPAYLAHLPRIERYFAASLRHPALAPVFRVLAEAGMGFAS